MDELDIIERFRQIIGDKTDEGYYTTVRNYTVPNFIGTDHKIEIPQIIIRPFITDTEMADADLYITDPDTYLEATPTTIRLFEKFKHARFQVDIYAQNLITVLSIKREVEERLEDFVELELLAFTIDCDSWTAYDSNVYLYDGYTDEDNILRISDPLGPLIKAEEIASMQPGTWYADDTGIYVYPAIDLASLTLFQKITGKVFPDGLTAYDTGITEMRIASSRKMKDKEPEVDRWMMELTVSYRTTREKDYGGTIEEMDLDVQKSKT